MRNGGAPKTLRSSDRTPLGGGALMLSGLCRASPFLILPSLTSPLQPARSEEGRLPTDAAKGRLRRLLSCYTPARTAACKRTGFCCVMALNIIALGLKEGRLRLEGKPAHWS